MKLFSIYDKEFSEYGRVIKGYDLSKLLLELGKTPVPEATVYNPSDPNLESLDIAGKFSDNIFGGMPIQIGWCNGHNRVLNCLEYHRDSEINLGTEEFILLLGKIWQIRDGVFDSSDIRAFTVPKGVLVEVYATTLHYAPCGCGPDKGFQVLVVLPKGTNTGFRPDSCFDSEDKLLWARNKWLLAHPESSEAASGAYIGIRGENIHL